MGSQVPPLSAAHQRDHGGGDDRAGLYEEGGQEATEDAGHPREARQAEEVRREVPGQAAPAVLVPAVQQGLQAPHQQHEGADEDEDCEEQDDPAHRLVAQLGGGEEVVAAALAVGGQDGAGRLALIFGLLHPSLERVGLPYICAHECSYLTYFPLY